MNSPKGDGPITGLTNSPFTRRGFFSGLLLTSAGLLLAAKDLSASKLVQQDYRAVYPPLRIEGAEGLMPGSALNFHYPSRTDPAILIRSPEGEYYAYVQKCSHMGCSVYFDRARGCLECPCHRGAYESRTGYVLHGPPTRPIDPIYLQMRAGGEVWAVGKGTGGNEHIAVADS